MSATKVPAWLAAAVMKMERFVDASVEQHLEAISPSDMSRLRVALDAPKLGPSRTTVELTDNFPETGFRIVQYRNNQLHRRFTVKADPKRFGKPAV
ncbi:MAG TPA: hypothetical protein VN081_04885 [Dongiaceae bacterium]|nr:hypothetical protein [Dongiaceae bacterium]